MTPEKTTPQPAPQVRSELTDIRFIIASALGLIGIFLLICAAFAGNPDEMAKTGDINANLIAGIALLGTLGGSLATALRAEDEREAALVTFLVTASGLALFGIGAAFWGLLAGVVVRLVLKPRAARV